MVLVLVSAVGDAHLQEYFKLIEEVKKKGTKEKIVLSKVKKGAYNRYPVSLWNTTVRNTLEQSISFLPLLWFCAVFGVDGISRASFGGWVWIGCRMMYPLRYVPNASYQGILVNYPGIFCSGFLRHEHFGKYYATCATILDYTSRK